MPGLIHIRDVGRAASPPFRSVEGAVSAKSDTEKRPDRQWRANTVITAQLEPKLEAFDGRISVFFRETESVSEE